MFQSNLVGMKKSIFALLFAAALGCSVYAQSELTPVNQPDSISDCPGDSLLPERPYYIYQIVTFSGSFSSDGVKVKVDDGQTIERLKGSDGEKIIFKTPAAALMYFFSQGWEMYSSGSTVSGYTAGSSFAVSGSSTTNSYWIFRKPCSKEKFEQAVRNGIAE